MLVLLMNTWRVVLIGLTYFNKLIQARVLMCDGKYSISACNSSYKKRVTWFNSEPVIATAIVEYIGEFVPSVVHGNAQHTTVPYRSLTSHQKSILHDGMDNTVRLQGRSGETFTRLLLKTLYQTVLLKMLDIISIRKTSPRAHTVWMWLMTFFLS
jgi:hypothetical protein